MPSVGLDDPSDIKEFDRKSRPFVTPKLPWTELGYEDPFLKSGRFRMQYYPIREQDPAYFSPDCKESVIGPIGVDSRRTTETISREIPRRESLAAWQDRRYFLDPNVRAIYEKFPITKQHPGLLFRLSGGEDSLEDKRFVGGLFPGAGFIREWPGLMPQSWKFMSAPFGEDCHVKTAVAAKYGLVAGTVVFMHNATTMMVGRGWRYMLEKWWYHNTFAVGISASWAAASCLACSLRGKDDPWNMIVGGLAVGAVVASRKSYYHAFPAALWSSVAGIFWFYWMASDVGINRNYRGGEQNLAQWDPASYKWMNWETNIYEPKSYKPINW